MSESEEVANLSYLAGVVDSDGCINLSIHMNNKRDDYSFRFRLIVTNTSLDLMTWIRATFKVGNVRAVRPSKSVNRKTLYEWSVCGIAALPVLYGIKDYLIVKKIQCNVAIEFLELKGGWSLNDQEFLWNEMKHLNQTGNSEMKDWRNS